MEQQPLSPTYKNTTDEELAAFVKEGIDAAERELLHRHMQAIYWLPQRAFGASEESLSGFLIYAIETIRKRDTLAKFDLDRGVRFTTWFGVVVRNLYLDYLRTQSSDGFTYELNPDAAAPEPETIEEDSLLDALQDQCRILFKLLLCNTFFLHNSEITWIAKKAGKDLLTTAAEISAIEASLRENETDLQDRYDKLAIAHWWTRRYERQLNRIEHSESTEEEISNLSNKMERRRTEYNRLTDELSGFAGIATASYKDIAQLLNMPEGTLASQISRCRVGASEILQQRRDSK